MIEALVVATATTGLFALAKGVRSHERFAADPRFKVVSRDETKDDLPCPWCYSPTDEGDARCPGCGRSFQTGKS